ncbi:MAG TPA: CoA-binding protein [Thermomicrobiales bacterium]|nr:CoA-binding protein [Thermomicrobiales bacterium]
MTVPALPSNPAELDDAALRDLLRNARTIAVIGWSDKEDRSSHGIAGYLHAQGYDVALVNPRLAGKMGPFGEPVYGQMAEIPRHVDIVDMFRNASFVPGHTREAIEIGAGVIWLQAGILSDEARSLAAAAGIPFVQNACISVAHLFLVRTQASGPVPE